VTASQAEIDAMHRAIALSALGLGSTSPNPPVGCVILDPEGRVAGEGHHQRKGQPHAEAHALAAAGRRARGGTAVVTLEPCNHHGRTPPCRQALLDAGITRTVIALIDPTSREEGGAARLRAAGVDVEVGLLADTARLVLGPWLHAQATRRPHTTWIHRIDPDGRPTTATPVQVTAAATGVDVIVHPDGHLVEARPGSHGADAFLLPTPHPDTQPADLLTALYTTGTRTILLATDPDTTPTLYTGLIDEIIVHLEPTGPSRRPSVDRPPPLVPHGFTVDSVTHDGHGIRLHAHRQEPSIG